MVSISSASAQAGRADAGDLIASMPAYTAFVVGALRGRDGQDVFGAADGLGVELSLEAGKGFLPHGITLL